MEREIEQKLNSIINEKITEFDQLLPEDELNEFLRVNKIKLPEEYAEFLAKYPNSFISNDFHYFFDDHLASILESDYLDIDYIMGSEFVDSATYYLYDHLKTMLPIAEIGDDYITIGISFFNRGKIYYQIETGDYVGNSYLLANSFNEFILSFKYSPLDED